MDASGAGPRSVADEREGPHREGRHPTDARGNGEESEPIRREPIEAGEVLDHRDARIEDHGVSEPPWVGERVDVERVDADEGRAGRDEVAGRRLRQERVVAQVRICVPQ